VQLPGFEPGSTGISTSAPDALVGFVCPNEAMPVQFPISGLYVGVVALVLPGTYATIGAKAAGLPFCNTQPVESTLHPCTASNDCAAGGKLIVVAGIKAAPEASTG